MINFLPRLFTGLLFLVAGLGKLTMMSPEVFAKMIEGNYAMIGLTGIIALIVSWIVIAVEILGGMALLAGNKISVKVFKPLIRLLILVTLVSISVHWGDISGVFKNLIIVAVLIQVCNSKFICPFGITGEKKS